ncbi:RNA polymerase sigma factor [Brevundimonas sp.]|uniref:RNA polymerase sigma factor n=1 Tax=Brevundimonas sp. TaxID=1871086 RepID=UPI00391B76EE
MALVREIDRWFIDQVLPHAPAYLRQARRWATDPEAARDIVQEAYARVIAAPDWRAITRPRAYVLMVVRNIAIDRLRQARLAPFDRRGDEALLSVEDDQPDAFQAIASHERLRTVRAAMAALPSQCRKCLEMRKFEELTVRQIADRLGLSVSTVEKHLSKGLRLVMEALNGEETTINRDDGGGDQGRRSQSGGGGLAGESGRRDCSA